MAYSLHQKPPLPKTHTFSLQKAEGGPAATCGSWKGTTLLQIGLLTFFILYISQDLIMERLRKTVTFILKWTLWITVYMTPTRLIFALEEVITGVSTRSTTCDSAQSSICYANKCRALRRIAYTVLTVTKVRLLPRFISEMSVSVSVSSPDESSSIVPKVRDQPVKVFRISRPVGLGNSDNSCYQNSVLQALASVPSLTSFLNKVDQNGAHFSQPTPFSSALKQFVKDLTNPKAWNKGPIWTPKLLKLMDSTDQQDAQEYWVCITESISKEIKMISERGRGREHLKAFFHLEYQKNFPFVQSLSFSIGSEPTQPINPIEGLISQRVGCLTCGFSEGISLQAFNCLTFTIHPYQQNFVRNMLHEFTALELLEDVECAKCTLTEWRITDEEALVEAMDTSTQFSSSKDPVFKTIELITKNLSSLNADSEKFEADDSDSKFEHTLHERKTDWSTLPELPAGSISQEAKEICRRLALIDKALAMDDFGEPTLSRISSAKRIKRTKTCQRVIARYPKALVLYFNRSFMDMTGDISKANDPVYFEPIFNLGPWCLNSRDWRKPHISEGSIEQWRMRPNESLIANLEESVGPLYDLCSVVTHDGSHNNGHYMCFRKAPVSLKTNDTNSPYGSPRQMWWHFNDERVSPSCTEAVLSCGNAFMLLYELLPDGRMPAPLIERQQYLEMEESYRTAHGDQPDSGYASPDNALGDSPTSTKVGSNLSAPAELNSEHGDTPFDVFSVSPSLEKDGLPNYEAASSPHFQSIGSPVLLQDDRINGVKVEELYDLESEDQGKASQVMAWQDSN
ncbi:MAG: hypothetical protein M1814_004897 [Vezdaea aestivalis]|nr:MAG: hypothetical protein M1814_004897 [Vezdaea aestivalis]